MNLADLRNEYMKHGLRRNDLCDDPIKQLGLWLQEAIEAKICEPNAVSLATANSEGYPSVRTVLIKHIDEQGVYIFTNKTSRKGIQLAANPHASIAIPWIPIERQITIEGTIAEIQVETAENYAYSRPRGSQISTWASDQSSPVPSRRYLEERYEHYEKKYEGKPIPMPEHWGGYCIQPLRIEFWQGRPNRLHDRFAYTRKKLDTPWEIQRLAP